LALKCLYLFVASHSSVQILFLFLLSVCLRAETLCLILFQTYLGRALLLEFIPLVAHFASLSAFSLPVIPTWPTVHLIVRLYLAVPNLFWRCFLILSASAAR
jgi:hypothetical protein